MTNKDRVVDYILKNTPKLSADKIRALASVVNALRGELKKEPNQIKRDENDLNNLYPLPPIDLTEVKKVSIDGLERKVNINA